MRGRPRSLAGRLFLVSALTTVVALAFAAVAIGHVLERFVVRGMDQQLDTEAAMLARAVRDDGTLDRARVVDLPMFATAGQGWGWRVEGPRGRWQGGDAAELLAAPAPAPLAVPPGGGGPDGGRAVPGDGVTDAGDRVHTRALAVPTAAGMVRVVAIGPWRLVRAPLREAMAPLLVSLAILGAALLAAAALQLRLGLRPLRRLRAALADVRAGRSRHVPAEQPDELAPLAAELNALVDRQEAQLAHARRHVANLAHGLKTPLAALAVKLSDHGRDPDGGLRAMVADIDGRVRRHLGRARAATPGGRASAPAALAPAIADLVAVMRGIHADRAIAATVAIDPRLAVAADPQDLDEMLGNLLDNAWRHARSTASIDAAVVGPAVRVVIEDDGPGLSDALIAQALVPGRRLDERGDGHGFGLPIALDLAELNGGTLDLGRSAGGGLRVVLTLPGSLRTATEAGSAAGR